MPYPSEWNKLCKLRKAHGTNIVGDDASGAELNRFAARYRLASSFKALAIEDYSDGSVDAYSAVLHSFLAYSALEQLHKAVKPDVAKQHLSQRWASWATQPASDLRKAQNILSFLETHMNSKQLTQGLERFTREETDNCLIVATALRNAVAHGFMTVHPEGTNPKTSAQFCSAIAEMLLQIADRAFTEFVESLQPLALN